MSGSRRMWLTIAVAAASALAVALILGSAEDGPAPAPIGAGADNERDLLGSGGMTRAPRALPGQSATAEPLIPSGQQFAEDEAREQALAEGPSGPPPASADQRSSAAAVEAYLRAINSRDGRAVCRSFERGALDRDEFPRRRPTCAATVAASLGYRDPRGLPIWRGSQASGPIASVVVGDRERATVTVTVTTTYAKRREPSIEDDVVYLERQGKVWLIVKPSATLYRAIGISDVPVSAISPPG